MNTGAVIPKVLLQHAEEAALEWLRRDAAVRDPHYVIGDLAGLDDRVDAHLDGLRIAGAAGWKLCRAELEWEEPEEVFAAGAVALDAGNEEWVEQVLDVAGGSLELSRGFVSAMGWLEWSQVAGWVGRLRKSDDPMRRRIGLAGAAVHRRVSLEALDVGLEDADPLVRARALKAAGEMGRVQVLPVVRHAYAGDDPEERFWAGWSGALLGDPEAVSALRAVAMAGGRRAEQACILAMRRARLADGLEWQTALAKDKERRRLALIGAGAIGDPALVPWILEQMPNHEVARVAGEAFSMITGVDLAYDDLERDWPEGFEAGPNEDPEDENVALHPDEDLPWPDPALVATWWADHSGRFPTGIRHLCGDPIREETLGEVLRSGFQRQRAAAALEQAMARPGEALFNVAAPGFRQAALLRTSK